MIFGLLLPLAAMTAASDSADRAREFAELLGLANVPPFTQIEESACASGSGATCTEVSSADISRATFLDSLRRELGAAGWRTPAPVEGWELGRPLIPDSLSREWWNDAGEVCHQRMRIERAETATTLHLSVSTPTCVPIQASSALPSAPSPHSSTLEALLGISVDAELREDIADCTLGGACFDSVRVMTSDAEAFRYEVEPALQAAGWEPLMIAESLEGGVIMQTYSRIHSRSPEEGRVVCADRLDYRHVASEPDARLTVQFANCQE